MPKKPNKIMDSEEISEPAPFLLLKSKKVNNIEDSGEISEVELA
ncbi:MAG: hypothetical protein NTV34_11420 [Proteobacteria bacterium]|nr:hypothetical protein [Pseudomonadota bacterium]